MVANKTYGRKIIINTFLTLDGVVQAPGGPEEDTTGDFKYGGWSFHFWDDIMGHVMDESMQKPFELLLGRKTYEIFAAHWPYIQNDPVADKFNSIKKYVVSNTINKLNWNNSFLIKGNVKDEIKKLKEENGPELQVHGSGDFIQTLLKNNLIDEYRLWIFPLTVGEGKRLFENGTIPARFNLISTIASSTGVVINTYAPGGELETGSFAIENETEEEIERRRKLASEK